MKYLLTVSAYLILLSNSVFAAPTVNMDTNYYSISGSSANELRKEMNSRRPNNYDAYTSWSVKWRFDWNTGNGQCSIRTVSSSVDVSMTLPKWANRNNANASLKDKWDSYYRALIAHENGHKDFGVDAATEIENRILNLTPAKSCQALSQQANALGNKVLNRYIALEKKYDRNTNHGMNDGAVFP